MKPVFNLSCFRMLLAACKMLVEYQAGRKDTVAGEMVPALIRPFPSTLLPAGQHKPGQGIS